MIRPVTLFDLPAYVTRDAFNAFIDKSPNPLMRYADWGRALDWFSEAADHGCLWAVGDYLVLYDIVQPPWSTRAVLVEGIVVRTTRTHGNSPATVAQFLIERAERIGAVAAVTGDMQVGAMVPHYQAVGFRPIGLQLIKDTTHGSNPQMDGGTGPG